MQIRGKTWTYISATGTNFLCLLFGVISGIITARLLGPSSRGELATILFYPGLFSTVFCLAVPQALAYFILKEPDNREAIVAAGVKLSFYLAIFGAFAFALLAPMTLSDDLHYLSSYVSIACLAGFPMVINTHLFAIHRGFHRFDFVNVMLLSTSLGYILILLLLWALNHISALTFSLSSLLLQWLIAAISLYYLRLPFLSCKVNLQLYRKILLHGLKLFIPVIVISIYGLSDRALIIRLATATDIGLYAVACSIAFPVAMASEAFAQLGFIEIAGIDGEIASVSLLARRFQMAQIIVFIAAIAILPIVYPVIIYGFGAAFLPAVAATKFLVVAMSLRGLSKTLEHSMRAKNIIRPGIISSTVAIICLVVLSSYLVPKRGISGFALAILFAEVTCLSVLLFSVKRHFNYKFVDLWGLKPSLFLSLIDSILKLIKQKRSFT